MLLINFTLPSVADCASTLALVFAFPAQEDALPFAQHAFLGAASVETCFADAAFIFEHSSLEVPFAQHAFLGAASAETCFADAPVAAEQDAFDLEQDAFAEGETFTNFADLEQYSTSVKLTLPLVAQTFLRAKLTLPLVAQVLVSIVSSKDANFTAAALAPFVCVASTEDVLCAFLQAAGLQDCAVAEKETKPKNAKSTNNFFIGR